MDKIDVKNKDKITIYKCNKCNKDFSCGICNSESCVRFKHRTHCYSGQLGIDFNCKEYHTCNECFTDSDEELWSLSE